MKKTIFLKSLLIAAVAMVFAAVVLAVVLKAGKSDDGAKKPADKAESSSAYTAVSSLAESLTAEVSSALPSSAPAVSSKPAVASSKPVQSSKPAQTAPAVQPKYVDGVLIVNKSFPVPQNFGSGVTAETNAAFNEMKAAAKNDGISLWIVSGYRSYSRQTTLYTNYCNRDGKAAADRYSARPGYSEHQTGLALDLNNASGSFAGTKEAKWLAENCWKYGFIIRYGEGKEQYTGFKYEPWHVRYLGKDLAKKVYDSGKCLEEYYNLPSKYPD